LVNATSGEPTTLTREERARLVDVAQDAAAGRCPICAGTVSQSHDETIALIDHYQKRGVDSVFVVTPYYCKPPQRALIEFFADVAQRTDRPLLIYHIPGRAAVRLTADTIVAIKDRADNFVGLKNTDDDLGLVTEALRRLGADFRIFCGWEPVTLPMLAVGACGAMLSASNVVPDRVAQLCELSANGDIEGARRLNESLSELFVAIDYDTSPIATKYMLKRIGVLEKNEHRLPMTSAGPELERRLDAVLGRAGLI
jgi:4-hydroxy-tetrahydrodipicolinate synthase